VSTVLLIAGSDSSGGAGVVRDVRTLTRLDTRALCVVTAVTAQSDANLSAVHVVPASLVRAQMTAALATRRVDAIKIGMLATRATVLAVAATLPVTAAPVVLDPVLETSSGGELLDDPGRHALCAALLPRTTLLTPNIPEAAALLGTRIARSEEELLEQARALLSLGRGRCCSRVVMAIARMRRTFCSQRTLRHCGCAHRASAPCGVAPGARSLRRSPRDSRRDSSSPQPAIGPNNT